MDVRANGTELSPVDSDVAQKSIYKLLPTAVSRRSGLFLIALWFLSVEDYEAIKSLLGKHGGELKQTCKLGRKAVEFWYVDGQGIIVLRDGSAVKLYDLVGQQDVRQQRDYLKLRHARLTAGKRTLDVNSDVDRKLFLEEFASAHRERYADLPYQDKRGDYVRFNALVATLAAAGTRLTIAMWRQALGNYFATPQSTHTLADLARRFATFYVSPLNEFAKPTGGSSGEGKSTRRIREGNEALDRFLDRTEGKSARDRGDNQPKPAGVLAPGTRRG